MYIHAYGGHLLFLGPIDRVTHPTHAVSRLHIIGKGKFALPLTHFSTIKDVTDCHERKYSGLATELPLGHSWVWLRTRSPVFI